MSEYQELIDGARGAAESSQNADENSFARKIPRKEIPVI